MAARPHAPIAIVLAAGLLLTFAGCSTDSPNPTPDVVVDLLQQDWQNTPGVTTDEHGLRVAATTRSIVEQDGSGGQPDPPLNLAGTHLEVGGDFTLRATFADVSADASWAVYDRPPMIADEFRVEPPGLRLTLHDDELEMAVFDGKQTSDVTQPVPVHEESVNVNDPAAPISVARSGDTLKIASDGRTLASIPFGSVFSSGKLWLGLSSLSGTFGVTSLTAEAQEGAGLRTSAAAVSDAEPSAEGLQALAGATRPDFRIGAAVALGPLSGDDDYARELVANFGAVTPENAMKPQSLSPRQGVYTFEEADAIVAAAKSKGMLVHGHTIAFSEAMPRWMQELPSGTDAEQQSSAAALLDYIRVVVTHFKGRLSSWDVVNEPFDVDQGTTLQQNVWYRVFGPGYPVTVSQAVYEADPDALQYINENGADVPGPRQDALRALALDTNARGGHIYGVGLQAHVYDLTTDAISSDQLASTLTGFQAAGLRVRISENDVTDDQGAEAQAQQYATILEVCLRSPACVSYTTWGVDDRHDWWVDDDDSLQQGHDFLFDDGEPTPAYDALRRVLGG